MKATIMVPVLSLFDRRGRIDRGACFAYAQRARETWLDAFLLVGSLGLGFQLPLTVRRELAEVWLGNMPVERLMVCAWHPSEVEEISQTGARPVLVLRQMEGDGEILDALRPLPPGSLIYSHPQYTSTVFSSGLAEKARDDGVLPAGAKVSKIDLADVRELRSAVGPEFALFDGRCRHVRASVEAGASGVVAVPLATLPDDLPARDDLAALQAVIDRSQAIVDSHPDVASQAGALRKVLQVNL
jgi:dihydrodipicolinate synthase/N-acetylneuraminate lyase